MGYAVLIRIIGEPDVLKLDSTAELGNACRVEPNTPLFHLALFTEHREHFLACSRCTLHDIEFLRKVMYGMEETLNIGDKHDEQAVRNSILCNSRSTEVDNRSNGKPAHESDKGSEYCINIELSHL